MIKLALVIYFERSITCKWTDSSEVLKCTSPLKIIYPEPCVCLAQFCKATWCVHSLTDAGRKSGCHVGPSGPPDRRRGTPRKETAILLFFPTQRAIIEDWRGGLKKVELKSYSRKSPKFCRSYQLETSFSPSTLSYGRRKRQLGQNCLGTKVYFAEPRWLWQCSFSYSRWNAVKV